jgi:hypothetical protein
MMSRKLTIMLDDEAYEGLHHAAGNRDVSQLIQDIVRPHVLGRGLDDGYRAMAADRVREAEAREWCDGLAHDMTNEAR